jgi:hypothetical protein
MSFVTTLPVSAQSQNATEFLLAGLRRLEYRAPRGVPWLQRTQKATPAVSVQVADAEIAAERVRPLGCQ